jgi:2-dehydro-3-deoxyphosphogluconate aldolase / (4S)-4-hydroxy-2-oxoglutarate aldolase
MKDTSADILCAALRGERLLAVIRAPDASRAIECGLVLAEEGFRVLEVTFTVPDAGTAIAELTGRLPDVLVGAGTVRSADRLELAVDAGAHFAVTPGVTAGLLPALAGAPIPVIPGVSTASEVMAVVEEGLDVVKLFPARTFGLSHLRDLRAPFPEVQVVVTGGVGIADIPGWLRAGALAVGLGSDLCSRKDLEQRDWSTVRAAAAAAQAAVATADDGGDR